MGLEPGTRLGPYEVISPIGAGGMGEVYRARDTRLDRTVAIKVVPAELSADPVLRRRLEREARTISSLNHPHICTLYDIGRQDQTDYLVLEYLEGQTLAEQLKRGPLPAEQVLRYGIQIADALEKAHRQGVVHRDLKPGNVMLTKSGAKLLDFGLAKDVHAPGPFGPMREGQAPHQGLPTASMALTAEGTLLGTFPYMSPEQLEGREADARSDIFALGAVLYEMAAGRKAFEGTAPATVMAAILEREPQPLTAVQPLAPAGLERLVKICLAKDPDERWQTAHDVKLQLQWLLEGVPQAGVPAPVTVRGRTRERVAWAAAAVAIIGALLLAVAYSRRELPPPAQVLRSSLLPPPSFSFVPYNFTLSPDGARLAFVAVGPDGRETLWVRELSASSAEQFTGTESAMFPFWSPDSRRIGFFAEGKLKTVDIAGGAVEVLCDAPTGRGGTWNADGTIVFAPAIAGPLERVSASGGVPTPATRIARQDSGQAHRWPLFLPDGRHFLYFVDWSGPEDPQGNGIYVGSLDSGEPKLISSELSGAVAYTSGNLLYVRDGRPMAQTFSVDRLQMVGPPVPIAQQELEKSVDFSEPEFSVAWNGVLVFQSAADSLSRLVWFDSSGKELEQIPGVGCTYPQLSPDGRYLALASDDEHNGTYHVRIYDLKRGISTRVGDVISQERPIWSHDGKRITYATVRAGTYYMEEIGSDGSGPAQVLLKGARMVPNDWSSDGRLVFMDWAKGRAHLEVYSVRDHQVTEFSAAAAEGQLSPDGKWIAYTGSGGRAMRDIFIQPFSVPGRRIQVSSAGGAQPRWSRDGRRIFYVAPDRKLMAVSFDPLTGAAEAPCVLFQTRIIAPAFALFQYDVSPDGRFLINSFPSSMSSPLTLITGWTGRLKGQ
jgi:serine/threonine protein kinase/Tol biopolymer transport system component